MGGNSGRKARVKVTEPVKLTSPLADEQKSLVKEVAPTKETLSAEKAARRTELLNLMNDILRAHGGLQSNIGLTSKYWDYLKEFRSLEPQKL